MLEVKFYDTVDDSLLLYGSGQVVIWKVDGYMKEKEHQSIEWKESWQDEC